VRYRGHVPSQTGYHRNALSQFLRNNRLCNQLCVRYRADVFISGYSKHVTILWCALPTYQTTRSDIQQEHTNYKFGAVAWNAALDGSGPVWACTADLETGGQGHDTPDDLTICFFFDKTEASSKSCAPHFREIWYNLDHILIQADIN
jgi:hypothetical protein